jgi:F-box and WD-40 domain protein 1/11
METTTSNSGNEEHSPMLTSSSSNCLLTFANNHSNKFSTPDYEQTSDRFLTTFSTWDDREQLVFVENLLKHMHSHQHGQINTFLLPMLQRDFVGQLAARGLEHIAEKILGYLNDRSLVSTELVCREWYHVISAGINQKILIESVFTYNI